MHESTEWSYWGGVANEAEGRIRLRGGGEFPHRFTAETRTTFREGHNITTAATGITAPGTVYRMDEIPLPLRPPPKSPYPTDEDVMRRIREAVQRKTDARLS